MIDCLTEDIIELGEARKYLPGRPDRATIWRWALGAGANGHHLESFVCGRKRHTSKQAIARFIEAQNQPADTEPPVRNGRKRKADDSAARERLAKAGLLK